MYFKPNDDSGMSNGAIIFRIIWRQSFALIEKLRDPSLTWQAAAKEPDVYWPALALLASAVLGGFAYVFQLYNTGTRQWLVQTDDQPVDAPSQYKPLSKATAWRLAQMKAMKENGQSHSRA